MTPGSIRAFNMETDAAVIARLDTSFASQRVYRPGEAADAISLCSIPLKTPAVKRFPLDLAAEPWQFAWVIAEGDDIAGFIATAAEEWNKRLVIWHFYVDRPRRGRGFGRRLMEHAIAHGAAAGMRTAWAETSNFNHPGVAVYRRLGFSVCGFDLTLYRGTPCEGEFALFLACPIGGALDCAAV